MKRSIAYSSRCLLLTATVLCALVGSAFSQTADDFFKKVGHITLYVASDAGGGYDQIGRFVAQNLTRFLPTHPPIIVDNMPGAGGVKASNFVYSSAPKDGSVILADVPSALALAIFDSPVTYYDPRKFEWIGSTTRNQAVCITWKTSGMKTLEDARSRVVTVGATAINESTSSYPIVLNALLGTKFKVVTGYSGGGMLLAMQQGEVEGQCGYYWQTLRRPTDSRKNRSAQSMGHF